MKNDVLIKGRVATKLKLDYEFENEKFYRFYLHSTRTGGTIDIIPVIVSEKLIDPAADYTNKWMCISGQYRSFYSHDGEKTKLLLYIFVNRIMENDDKCETNDVLIEGEIAKEPVFRETPNGRLITDLLIAVKRNYSKSDYIPCIAWGRNAIGVSTAKVGTEVRLAGRIQSREYNKDGAKKIAYELSINLLEVVS